MLSGQVSCGVIRHGGKAAEERSDEAAFPPADDRSIESRDTKPASKLDRRRSCGSSPNSRLSRRIPPSSHSRDRDARHTLETISHVGVDVSKRHLDVASSGGSSVKRFDNLPHGLEQLLRGPPQVVTDLVGLENSTAPYFETGNSRVVQDNLPTHKPAARCAAFPPEEARRRIDKREVHDTPKPVSWLDMAEIERASSSDKPPSPDGRQDHTANRNRSLAADSPCSAGEGPLAVLHTARQNQTSATLPNQRTRHTKNDAPLDLQR